MQDKDALNNLYSELIKKRDQVALNAGFENYRDYKFVELGRFDYTKEDCFQFHEACKATYSATGEYHHENKKKKLGLDTLRPWDMEAEPVDSEPLILLKPEKNCWRKPLLFQ